MQKSSREQGVSSRKVLITGANGFLGSHLVARLERLGASVYAVSRSTSEHQGNACRITADLSKEDTVSKLFNEIQPELVIHLAGYGVGSPGIENVLPTLQNDVATAINVMVAGTRAGTKRLLFAASLEEPEPGTSEVAGSPYAAAKWTISMYAAMFHKLYRTPLVMLRPFMTYGPGQKEHKLIPYATLSMLRGESPTLGSGLRLADWVFVEDVVEAFVAALTASDIEGSTFDLGSGQLVSIRNVITKIADLIGGSTRPVFGGIPDRPTEKVRAAETSQTEQLLQWKSNTTLEDGLRQTIAWYQGQLSS